MGQQAVAKATGQQVDSTTGVMLAPLEEATTTLDRYVYSPTYEAAGFASLLANPDSWSTESGQRLDPSEALSKAWAGRREISLGNANADLLAEGLNKLPDWGPLAEFNKVDLDIYQKEIRDRIYERKYNEAGQRVDAAGNLIESASWVENAFRGFSMVTDTTKQLVLDPLWFAGKGWKGFRLAKLDKFRPEAIVDTAEFAKHQEKVGAANQVAREQKLKLIEEAPELERATAVLAEIRANRMFDDSIKAEVNTVREARGLKPYSLETPKDVYIRDYEKYIDGLKKKQLERKAVIDDVNSMEAPKPTLAAGVSEFVNQIVTRQMNWREIERHRTLQDFAVEPEFLAKALAEAAKRGEAAVTDVLLLAQASDPSALIRLRGQHENLLTLIDRAQTQIDRVEVEIQRAITENGFNDGTFRRLNIQQQELFKYVKALKEEDEYLTRLTTIEGSIVGSLPGTPFSVSPIIERYRANKAIVSAGIKDGSIKPLGIRNRPDAEFDWTRVQRGPLHVPTYVAQWVGHRLGLEKPSGLVTVEGLDRFDGVKEFRTYLDNSPVLKGMVTIKTGLLDEYVAATDSLGRKKVLEDAEKAIVYQTAKRYGLHEETTTIIENGQETVRPTWEVIHESFLQERAKAVEAFKRDKVFAVDQNGTQISNPVLESQLEYAVPMLDTRALDNFFYDASKNKDVFKGAWRSIERKREQWVLPAWKTFDTLWRADVLLRLGYPQRNVLAEWLVLANYDNGLLGMFSVGSVGQAAANFAKNRWSHFQDIQARYQFALDAANQSGDAMALATLRSITPKQLKWSDYEQFAADQIQILKDRRQGIFDFAAEFMASPNFSNSGYKFPYEELEILDNLILREEQKLAEIAKRVEARGERFGKKNIRGKGLVRVGVHEFAGVFDGQQGVAAEKLTSSSGRMGFDRNHWSNALKEMGLERTGQFTDIHPTDDSYFGTLASIINQQLQGSRTAMMIISGRSDEDILAYLSTPSGRKELERLNWDQDILEAPSNAPKTRKAGGSPEEAVVTSSGVREVFKESLFPQSTPENYLDFVKYQVINRYLPNDAMMDLVKTKLKTDEFGRNAGTVTSADLRVAAGDTQLNPIHGEQLELKSVMHNRARSEAEKVANFVNESIFKRLFRWLGEYPEDAFVSHPFAANTYEVKLKEIVDTWTANNITPTNEDVLRAQTIARKWAVKQSRDYLYRVTRKNSIANAIPILAPFFQAQYSTFKRVGKLSYRNPDKSARVVFAWNQINTHSYQDEDGQRWYTVHMPSSWYDDKGLSNHVPSALKTALSSLDETKWNVNSFNLLLAGLRMPAPDVLPGSDESTGDKMNRWVKAGQSIFGVGPIVQLGANLILRNNPALDDNSPEIFGHKLPRRNFVEIFASPYPSDKWYDPLMSGWNKRVASLVFGEDNNDFERTQLVMFQAHIDRQRTGEEELLSDDPQENADMLWKMASEEASAFIALRLVVNLGSGFIPSYEGRMTPYVELYRAYQTKYGVKAYDEWLKDYPDMGYIAISRSQNLAGSSASTDAVSLRAANNDMIEQAIKNTGLPREEALSFVQMITNGEIGAEVLRDPYATTWQKKKGDRLTLSAEEGYENQKVREGWAFFMNDKESFDLILRRQGISRYSKAADQLNFARRMRLAEYGAQNPEWWQEYTTLSTANSAVGYVRAMKTALEDEKFLNSLSDDSYWWNIQAILRERDALIEATRRSGLATPSKEMQEAYGRRIETYLQDPTTSYYFSKFLDNDGFDKDQLWQILTVMAQMMPLNTT